MKKMAYLLVIMLLVAGSFFCSKKNSTKPEVVTIEDLLIKDNEMSGWTRTGVHWVARSSGDLANYINGEAALYTNYDFVEAAKQEYQGSILETETMVELRIFDQSKSASAEAVFDELVRQMSSPIVWDGGAGTEARIERYSLSQRIIFYKSKYFVSLSIDSGVDEALDVLKTFANNVDSKIK